MAPSIRRLFVVSLVLTSGISCLLGLAIGTWSFLEEAKGREHLLRSTIVLLAAGAFGMVLGLILAKRFVQATRDIREALNEFGQGTFSAAPRPAGPAEWVDLALQVRELGVVIERREHQKDQECKLQSYLSRTDALQRFGGALLAELEKPITGVAGLIDLAVRQPNVDGSLKNYLTLIERESRNARDVIDRLRRYLRPEAQVRQSLDVNTLLKQVLRDYTGVLSEDRVERCLNLDPELPRVAADAVQLKSVVGVLIDNAREAMLPAGGTLDLSTNLVQDKTVVVSIKDSGRGIADADRERIFTPFFTTKSDRKDAGLNLAISEQIVKAHSGELTFWSKPGEGTVFFIMLPVALPAAPIVDESQQITSPIA